MFRRILVPVDATARGTEAADVGRRLAERGGANLVLLHVAGTDAGAEHRARVREAMNEVEREAHGGVVESHFERGEPAKVIAEVAHREAADVIVLAPHHRGWLEEMAHPSVTGKLLPRVPAPLLVWPEDGRGKAYANFLNVPNSQVIVALDGSDLAEAALPHAIGFAREYARPLLLVRVVAPSMVVGPVPEAGWFEVEREEALDHEARAYLGSVRRRLAEETRVPVRTMVAHGAPAIGLARIAATHDGSLLVIATHGRGGLSRLLMGSVAARVVKDAPVPVLVVPPTVMTERFGQEAPTARYSMPPAPSPRSHTLPTT